MGGTGSGTAPPRGAKGKKRRCLTDCVGMRGRMRAVMRAWVVRACLLIGGGEEGASGAAGVRACVRAPSFVPRSIAEAGRSAVSAE